VTGVPFIEYVNGVRVKEAERLLKKTNMSIIEIAEAVGFKSTTHFGRTFKGTLGISPIEYRRRRRTAAK
jgi:transcriptional regulator GlxA family with amidase domain